MVETTHSYNNHTVTGTTTAAYVVALTIGNCAGAIFKITNLTGATQTMYYKIDGYTSGSPLCASEAITAQTDVINATPVINTAVNRPYAKVEVSVINHSAACAYQIDYIAY
jgi:hypothetical protein